MSLKVFLYTETSLNDLQHHKATVIVTEAEMGNRIGLQSSKCTLTKRSLIKICLTDSSAVTPVYTVSQDYPGLLEAG